MYGQPFALGCPRCGEHCPIQHVVTFADRSVGLDGFCVTDDCPNDGKPIMSLISAEQLEEGFARAKQWDTEGLKDMEQPKKPNGLDDNPWFS